LIADQNCKAVLPNYALTARVTGGCLGYSITQTPAAGTILTATNQTIQVVLKATGTNNKSTTTTFPVNLIDTITPQFLPIADLIDTLQKRSDQIYDIADKMVGQMETLANKAIPWDQYPGMHATNNFQDKMLMVVSARDSAGTGRIRTAIFTDNDTISLPFYKIKLN
jgi:hypothetical protein